MFNLFITFLKIGLCSIGGGYAIIPMIQQQVVLTQGWISEKVFTDIITISQMTPGPLAVNTSTFVGIQIAGIPGAIVATVGCILCGILISTLLYEFFKKYKHSKYIFEILKSLKATSLGLIVSAAFTILLLTFFGTSTLNSSVHGDLLAMLMFGAALFLLRKYKVNPIVMMSLCGVIGLFIYM